MATATVEAGRVGAPPSSLAGAGAVGAQLIEAARRFGPQGEGAIEGVHTDYTRVALDVHAGAQFARFEGCRGLPLDEAWTSWKV